MKHLVLFSALVIAACSTSGSSTDTSSTPPTSSPDASLAGGAGGEAGTAASPGVGGAGASGGAAGEAGTGGSTSQAGSGVAGGQGGAGAGGSIGTAGGGAVSDLKVCDLNWNIYPPVGAIIGCKGSCAVDPDAPCATGLVCCSFKCTRACLTKPPNTGEEPCFKGGQCVAPKDCAPGGEVPHLFPEFLSDACTWPNPGGKP